jgi:hypothetical protein
MEADELWVESYQGEILGEVVFSLMAERAGDPLRRQALQALALLESSTRQMAEPLLKRRGIDPGGTEATVSEATAMASTAADLPWTEFLGFFQPEVSEFLAKYRRLVVLARDEYEREVAEAYVAHEEALETFLRRSLGEEPGDPLEAILTVPHVAAAKPG